MHGDLFAVAASCEVEGYKFSENGLSVVTQLHIFKLAEEGRLLKTLCRNRRATWL